MTGATPTKGMEPWRIESYRSIGVTIALSTRKGYEQAIHQFEEFTDKVRYIVDPSQWTTFSSVEWPLRTGGCWFSSLKARL